MALTPFTLKAPSQEDATPDARNAPFEGHPFLPHPATDWLPHKNDTIAIAATSKVASSAIRKALGLHNLRLIHPGQLADFKRVIGFVRDPMDRVESNYNYFHTYHGHFPQSWDKTSGIARVRDFDTYEDFVDAILLDEGFLNKHWMPQDYNMQGLPTEYHRLEDAGAVLAEIGLNLEPNVNTSGVPLTGKDYRQAELMAFYKADYALLEDICPGKYGPSPEKETESS